MENIVRKGEIDCNKQFLLFSQRFLPYSALTFYFDCTLKISPVICFNFDQSKILSSGNGLKVQFDISWCHNVHNVFHSLKGTAFSMRQN